ncbi:MAG TPA: Sec-independent protein translocase subunit TatA/TatB [Candidatus Avalokitesvara rifleensis]|uniref:Sec-independent protein translocase subunit TatA/TatB n=1 Tax=Candidatus Avalokitesvara rifleensis TaxID=3367620 RepID=UPI00402A2BC8
MFGKRLPDVMRSLGKGIVEFKKGVRGIEDDVDKASTEEAKKKLEKETQKREG